MDALTLTNIDTLCPDCLAGTLRKSAPQMKGNKVYRYLRLQCDSCQYYEATENGYDRSTRFGLNDNMIETPSIIEHQENRKAHRYAPKK